MGNFVLPMGLMIVILKNSTLLNHGVEVILLLKRYLFIHMIKVDMLAAAKILCTDQFTQGGCFRQGDDTTQITWGV